jgi:hypothetical protein
MKPIVLLFFTVLISCCKYETVDTCESKIYSEWINYYDVIDYDTYFNVNSFATINSGDIIFTAFIRRNNFTIDSTWIFKLHDENILPIDSSVFFSDYNSFSWENNMSEKKIFTNNELLFLFDRNENICCQWYVSDLKNKLHSSKCQIDKNGNIWIASNAWKASNDGIQRYNGTTWTTYFEGSTFYAICFDKSGNLYASTMPDFEEPGIIMRYNYYIWDTVIICSGNAKWVPCMHFDNDNNLWFGVLSRWNVAPESGDGLYKYDGANVTNYNIYNSKLPSNSVVDIAIDGKNNKWIAMYSGGLAKFNTDGSWKVFNTDNTPLTNISVEHVLVDDNNYVWFTVYSMGMVRLKE